MERLTATVTGDHLRKQVVDAAAGTGVSLAAEGLMRAARRADDQGAAFNQAPSSRAGIGAEIQGCMGRSSGLAAPGSPRRKRSS